MTTKKALAPVPDPEPDASEPATIHVELPDGQWADFTRELSGEDFLMLYRITRADEDDLIEMYGPILDMIERHVVKHSYGGKILRQPVKTLLRVWTAWNSTIKAEALDPGSADS